MTKHFLLFRDGRRLRAAHLELPRLDVPLLVDNRRFAPAGSFLHLNHVTDSRKHLLGFVVDDLERANSSSDWRAWWSSFDNRDVLEFWQAYIFLAEQMPDNWHDDCALLVVNAPIFSDNTGDYLLVIPDHNGFCYRPGEPTEFWKEIGFELRPLSVAVEGTESAAC